MQDNQALKRWTPNGETNDPEKIAVKKEAVQKADQVNVGEKTGMEKTRAPSSITIGTGSFFRSTQGKRMFPRQTHR